MSVTHFSVLNNFVAALRFKEPMKPPATPYLLDSVDSTGRPLERHDVQSNETRTEPWLQRLLYQHPELLPVTGFGTSFGPLIPLGREIPTRSGPIDLLYASPEGLVTMVETKLWKNPESHRTVAAQVIDYAKELASWGYDELCGRVLEASRRRDRPQPLSLEDRIVPALQTAGEELHPFQEALVENLARGKFLVLIVGDRVSPNLVLLSQTIQAAPGLEFTIGLVELRFYRLRPQEEWPLIVVPEIVGRTVEMARGIIRIKYENERPGVRIETEPEEKTASRMDVDQFLEMIPADLVQAFREGLVEWQGIGGTVRCTNKRLFLEAEAADSTQKFVRLQPSKMSVITQSIFHSLATDPKLYSDYLNALEKVPPAANAARGNVMWIPYVGLTRDDVLTIVRAAIQLAKPE